jgi:nucleoside-diphosphate-sugar epimerase
LNGTSTSAPTLRERYRGQRILITGASGLLGQAVLEKILRALPDVAELIVLLRSRGRVSARDRVADLFRAPLFDRLRAERPDFDAWWPTKVTVVGGQLGRPGLGLDPADRAALVGRITAILHMGALASFDEPLDRVLEVNTSGSLDVLELARDAGNVPLVHVSTCYVCGNTPGTHREEAIPWGHTPRTLADGSGPGIDPEIELRTLLQQARQLRLEVETGVHDDFVARTLSNSHMSTERLEALRRQHADERLSRMGVRVATIHGWPDPYPMSKAWAEQLLEHRRGSVPLAIVRPAILASTHREPEPGWLIGLRMADPLIVAMGRASLEVFPGDRAAAIDLVPCDLAVNAILAALPERGASEPTPVYQVAGSARKPLSLGDFHDLCYAALRARPFLDVGGSPVEPSRLQFMPSTRFQRALTRERRTLRLKIAVLERIGMASRARTLRAGMRFLGYANRLGRTYAPFIVRHFTFTTDRLRRLESSLSPADREQFPMDVGAVDWKSYVVDVHVPAVRREGGGNGNGKAHENGAGRAHAGRPVELTPP